MTALKLITSNITVFLCSILLLSCWSCEERIFPEIADDPEVVFDTFWKEVDRNYSSFDDSGINWDSVYISFRPTVSSNTSGPELFNVMDKALTLLNDGHLNIHTPHGVGGNTQYFSAFPENPIVAHPEGRYFESYHVINRQLGVGKIQNAPIGYLRIKTFDGPPSDFAKIDSVLQLLSSTAGLIIDVRSNYGGNINNAELIASAFVQSTQVAYEYRVRNGHRHADFTPWYTVKISPSPNRLSTGKKVVVLTNRGSFSATEWFVLFMNLHPGVVTAGDTTGGGGAIPITRELPNGWILRIPNTQTRLPSGEVFQRAGIPPDVPVWIQHEDQVNGVDTILESAIALIY